MYRPCCKIIFFLVMVMFVVQRLGTALATLTTHCCIMTVHHFSSLKQCQWNNVGEDQHIKSLSLFLAHSLYLYLNIFLFCYYLSFIFRGCTNKSSSTISRWTPDETFFHFSKKRKWVLVVLNGQTAIQHLLTPTCTAQFHWSPPLWDNAITNINKELRGESLCGDSDKW